MVVVLCHLFFPVEFVCFYVFLNLHFLLLSSCFFFLFRTHPLCVFELVFSFAIGFLSVLASSSLWVPGHFVSSDVWCFAIASVVWCYAMILLMCGVLQLLLMC